MSVTYIDEQQKESVKKLLNYVLKNFQEELSRGDFKTVYYKIFGNYPQILFIFCHTVIIN